MTGDLLIVPFGQSVATGSALIRTKSWNSRFCTPVNPNGGEEVTHRSPEAIMNDIAALDAESAEVLQTIRSLL